MALRGESATQVAEFDQGRSHRSLCFAVEHFLYARRKGVTISKNNHVRFATRPVPVVGTTA